MKIANAKFQNTDSVILMRRGEHFVLNLCLTAHKYVPLSHQLPNVTATPSLAVHMTGVCWDSISYMACHHNCNIQNWNLLLFTLQSFTQFDDSELSIIPVLSTGIFMMSYEFPGWKSKL